MPPAAKRRKKEVKRAVPVAGRAGRPLSERYAPHTLDEVAMYPKTRESIRDWILDRAKEGQTQGMLLVLAGRPGIGKSAAVEAICAEAGLEIARWRGVLSGESQMNQFRSFLEEARYPRLGENRRGLIMLEELPTDERFRAEMCAVLLEAADVARRPIVLVWSEGILEKSEARIVLDRIFGTPSFLDAASIKYIEVNPVTELKICARLAAIAAAERQSQIQFSQFEAIAHQADGDIRAAISRLQLLLIAQASHFDNCIEEKEYTGGIAKDDDQGRYFGDATADLHAIGRLLRARRDNQSQLTFDPERVIHMMNMQPETTTAFLQYNCIPFFSIHGPPEDLWNTLNDFTLADLFISRKFSTTHARDTGDPVYPQAYFASIAARTVAARNTKPATSAFRPIHKPILFDLPRPHENYFADIDITPTLYAREEQEEAQRQNQLLSSASPASSPSILMMRRSIVGSLLSGGNRAMDNGVDSQYLLNFADTGQDDCTSGLLPEDDIVES